ncbi:MAG: hypothetical protein ACYCY7_13160 [Gallionella sp.]
MNEYIFFDGDLRDSFVEYVGKQGAVCELREDTMGLVVAVAEDLSDDLVDTLEARYDELQEEQADLMSRVEGGLGKLAGFKLALPDGQTCMVPLQPEMASRLLSCFSFEEIQVLFDAVARSALNPKDSHLCEILHAGTNSKRK